MNVREVTQFARDIRTETLKSLNHLGFGMAAVCRWLKRWRYCMA